MCGDCVRTSTRREALLVAALGALAVGTGATGSSAAQPARGTPVEVGPGLTIRPRDSWGRDLAPVGPTQAEQSVKFLLVHHTAGSNRYGTKDVESKIREVYSFHTSPAKGWVDVCYNFFIDRFGGVWEGRAGSLNGPILADATGGNQGFAQLVCLLGNFETDRPPAPMMESCAAVLGWLADRYGIPLDQSRTVQFRSRGSNRWPNGSLVKARPISGHRDMSATLCPGKFVYPMLESEVPARAAEYQASLRKWRRSPRQKRPSSS